MDAVVVARANPPKRRSKHLCADAGYRGKKAEEAMIHHGYIPHVKSRKEESKALKSNPNKKARRWIVEVAHSWFNRFRKLLVCSEKLESSFLDSLPYIAWLLPSSLFGKSKAKKYYLRISSNSGKNPAFSKQTTIPLISLGFVRIWGYCR